jgi:hypothetical protein
MLLLLELKDVLGPSVSLAAAAVSAGFAVTAVKMTRKTANRSIYVDGQKFLIEICKHLTAEPLLWCIYDKHPLRSQHSDEIEKPLFQARLRAFAHLHLNMFEIILNEIPPPGRGGLRNPSNMWIDYFHDTLNRAHILGEVLEERGSEAIWSEVLMNEYRRWKNGARLVYFDN